MSHLGAQNLEGHPDEQRYHQQHQHQHKQASSFPFPEPSQDNSNVGRAYTRHGPSKNSAASSASGRSQRKPAPSPLHASTAVSPSAGLSPPTPNVPSPLRNTHSSGAHSHDNPSAHNEGTAYYDSDSDSSEASTTEIPQRPSARPGLSPRQPDDSRSVSESAVRQKTAGSSSSTRSIPTMAESSASSDRNKALPLRRRLAHLQLIRLCLQYPPEPHSTRCRHQTPPARPRQMSQP